MNPWLMLAAVGAIAAAAAGGYVKGVQVTKGEYARAELAADAAREVLENKLAVNERTRLDLLEANRMLSTALEDEARADPAANVPAITADSVRRLNKRRGP